MRIHLFLPFDFLLLMCFCVSCGTAQPTNERIGGPFENHEYMFIDMPSVISEVDTSPAWNLKGQQLVIQGRVLRRDGKTPVPNVLLYYYHTNPDGIYFSDGKGSVAERRHGYIRGWVKSGPDGAYKIFTVRPGPYPNRRESAHIHISVKEPQLADAYYLDSFVFDDDKLLTGTIRKKMRNRGGSGVLRLRELNGVSYGNRDIILGLHIPHYPYSDIRKVNSGREIGEEVFSFTPYHVWGPDKGSKACPVCKYGKMKGILYAVGNRPDWKKIKHWLEFLEKESENRTNQLRVFFVYGNEHAGSKATIVRKLETLGKELSLKFTALTYVPSFSGQESEIHHLRINQEVEGTILIYDQRRIVEKIVNPEPGKLHFQRVLDQLRND